MKDGDFSIAMLVYQMVVLTNICYGEHWQTVVFAQVKSNVLMMNPLEFVLFLENETYLSADGEAIVFRRMVSGQVTPRQRRVEPCFKLINMMLKPTNSGIIQNQNVS